MNKEELAKQYADKKESGVEIFSEKKMQRFEQRLKDK